MPTIPCGLRVLHPTGAQARRSGHAARSLRVSGCDVFREGRKFLRRRCRNQRPSGNAPNAGIGLPVEISGTRAATTDWPTTSRTDPLSCGNSSTQWRALARACGPVTVYAEKTRIVFQARVRFAGAIVHNDWLDAALWLRRRVEHRCLHRVESFGRLGYGIHFRLATSTDIDKDSHS